MSKYTLGIDIGGTFIKYALVDEAFNIIQKWKEPTIKFETKEEFYDYVCSNIKELDNIEAIGVSCPGLVDEKSNIKSYAAPSVRPMYGTNVNGEIIKRTGKKTATINDAKSAGLCELKIGNARGTKSSAFLIIGTGAGGCLCNEYDVVYGKDGFAGEFHHIPFLDFNSGKILRQGDYSSMTALIKIYNNKVREENKVKYGHDITEKYLFKDEIAIEAMNQWIKNMATQLMSISVCYNPDVICIGGGISEEQWFIELITNEFNRLCSSYLGENVISTRIDKCAYNNDANILGAILKVKM